MSYRTFKRVLGETSLERKCRWWFGVSLAVMLLLSFTWYGHENERLLDDQIHTLVSELVRSGWQNVHLQGLPRLEKRFENEDPEPSDELFYEDLVASSKDLGHDYQWDPILAYTGDARFFGEEARKYLPRDEYERELLAKWAGMEETSPPQESERPRTIDGSRVYQYYQPIYAHDECILCHRSVAKVDNPYIKAGDLMAVARVTINDQPTVEARAKNQALLWTAAVVVGGLSMLSLWAIVRYVIVKPVTHLRDVANAIRHGDTNARAQIRTGDEFEELAAAFNRMLRQLLSHQGELQRVNDELDTRLDELAQANMRLFEMNRLKGDFLATVSHELRTPLNSIIGFSDVLRTIDTLDEKQRRYATNIQRSGKILLDMIDDILDLAKMESGKMDVKPTEFQISSVVAAQCDMARPLTERKNIDLELAVSRQLPPMYQDAAKVQQILNNLLSNAIKFTPEGGRIQVTAEQDSSGDLRLRVMDTGVGIGEEDQKHIFEKFRQGTSAAPGGDAMTREHPGTGLGLSIVRELCRLLGGDVTLESALGKGSTFTVHLPWQLEFSPQLDAHIRDDLERLTRGTIVEHSAGSAQIAGEPLTHGG